MTDKRFVLFLTQPGSPDDGAAARLLHSAPHALTSQLLVFPVNADTVGRVPPGVRSAGTPALLDQTAKTLAPSGRETLLVLSKLLEQANKLEVAQSAAAARLVSALDSFAPPEPGCAAVTSRPSAATPSQTHSHHPYHSFHTADRDPRLVENHADPRSMPGSSMPHTSQMNAPFASTRPDVPHVPVPPNIEGSGVAGPRDGPAPSTLGPNGTIGGGIGTPGGTRGFGRPGFGLGTSIADTMDNSVAGIPNTPEASQYAMQLLFGGAQTPYDVEQGRMPPYMAGRNMRGSTLAPEHSFAEGGVVSEEAIQRLDDQRKASEAMLKANAGTRAGSASITTESDKGTGGMGLRQQSAARLAGPSPLGGFESAAASGFAAAAGFAAGPVAAASLAPMNDTLRSGAAQRKEASTMYDSMGMSSSSITAMPGMASGMTNVAF